jgi:hypothetical protein
MAWVTLSVDKTGFVLAQSRRPFAPWGFNYEYDERGSLLEDHWDSEWPTVEADFAEMKKLGANIVRIHLQLAKFMNGPKQANRKALERLSRLVGLAEREGLYVDVTGLGCYHKPDVPQWYDDLDEEGRWSVQTRFWEAVAAQCARSPAVFRYELMNEPVVPDGRRDDRDWLGPPFFGGNYFVQFITLDQRGRSWADIAQRWIQRLVAVIRTVDRRHLVTVGLLDFDRKGVLSGFVPEKIVSELDFLSAHLYPETGKFDELLRTLKAFSIGKPIIVEETFPLQFSPKELDEFIDRSKRVSGWISFYWGKPPEALRQSNKVGDAILLQWLELFGRRAKPKTNLQKESD